MPHSKKEQELIQMIKRYVEGKASAEEIDFLSHYFDSFDNQPDVLATKSEEEKNVIGEKIWAKVMDRTVFQKKERAKVLSIARKRWYNVAAAASVILLVSLAIYFLKPTPSKEIAKNFAPVKQLKNDAVPGGNKAVLTLADGSTILLDSIGNGNLAQQGNSRVIKLNDGKLAYQLEEGKTQQAEKLAYNTVSTPRGGQYQLTLSDGSKVWLNAASSITFPTSFEGNKRDVTLSGEAYFEVAHNAKMPFHVKVGDMQVQVLGTHFNINAYGDDELIKTTLLEGSVKVTKGNSNILISPGEQARVDNSSSKITVKKDVDLDEVIAWKNGLFQFNKADIKTIMQQVSRWYNVNVLYQGNIPKREFSGKIQRDLNLSQLLDLLGKNKIHFKIEGQTLLIIP